MALPLDEQLEQLYAQLQAEINATRVRFNDLERGDFDNETVLRALGSIHGSQMDAEKVLRREIAGLAQQEQDRALTELLSTVGGRLPIAEEA